MIKPFFIVVAVVCSLFYIPSLVSDLDLLFQGVPNTPLFIGAIAIAVVIQLIGHYFRARRTKIILDQASKSSTRFQYGTLSIGYLFNALLPLRLGELVRSILIAKRLRISFLYTFVAVVIERSIDVIFLGILLLVGALIVGGQFGLQLALFGVVASIFAILLLVVLFLAYKENKYVLGSIWKTTSWFNSRINNSLRFKVWSLLFGLQSFMNKRDLVRRYIYLAMISWTCYFVSVLVLILPVFSGGSVSALQLFFGALAPYTSSIPSWGLVSFSGESQIQPIVPLQPGVLDGGYPLLLAAVLTVPMAVIGLAALIVYRTKKSNMSDVPAFSNKLLRYDDISQEFPAFLDTYFKGYSLSRILHKIELTGELSLVKFFKGGSDAITVLAMKDGKLFVKKIVPAEYTDRLRVQYKWLKKYDNKKQIIDVLAEHKTDDYYAIDLAYDPENISLFEYLHTHSLRQSKQAIDTVWKYVFTNIYTLKKETLNTAERDAYIEERLMKKMKGAVVANEDLRLVIDANTILINGEKYDNFYAIVDKIKHHKQAWRDLATYRKSDAIHGDLTIDNILMDVASDKPVIIDPSDDNQIRGPIIDFARHTQSLVAGYEFLNNDDEATKAKTSGKMIAINYHDRRSARYMQLHDYVQTTIAAKYLTDTERRTVLFHTGLLYGRMLAHRVTINPHNTLKYYAVSVMLLNEFYRQYDN